jgi:uncharacterized protein YggE
MKIFITVALACLPLQVIAQQSASSVSSIRVTGDAVVTAKPDRARIDVGVVTQAPQSQDAAAQNARRVDGVLAALRKALGASADIKTISYSLNPNYQYQPNGREPKITGYTATNVVRVTLDDLAKIGNVIDGATQAGANQVQSIQFTLRDEQAVRGQALREAALKARAEADALAAALGLKINRIMSVEEAGPIVVPMRDVMFAARAEAAAAPTPIQAGTIEVTANVTLTVEVTAR